MFLFIFIKNKITINIIIKSKTLQYSQILFKKNIVNIEYVTPNIPIIFHIKFISKLSIIKNRINWTINHTNPYIAKGIKNITEKELVTTCEQFIIPYVGQINAFGA